MKNYFIAKNLVDNKIHIINKDKINFIEANPESLIISFVFDSGTLKLNFSNLNIFEETLKQLEG